MTHIHLDTNCANLFDWIATKDVLTLSIDNTGHWIKRWKISIFWTITAGKLTWNTHRIDRLGEKAYTQNWFTKLIDLRFFIHYSYLLKSLIRRSFTCVPYTCPVHKLHTISRERERENKSLRFANLNQFWSKLPNWPIKWSMKRKRN